MRKFVPAIIAVVLLPAAGWAAPASGDIEAAVDKAFRPLMAAQEVPGLAVAVTVDGRHYFFSYGVASKEGQAPVTKDTLFEIGSVSKTFTATLAVYAQTLGKLSLQDHPGTYMPQLRGGAVDNATLLNLGTYTAGGLPLQFPDTVTDDAGMVRFFRQWKPSAPPGRLRRYSNPSIGLLGRITAMALGGDFTGLVEKTLFPGLGLKRSYIRVPEAEMGNYAWGYDAAGRRTRVGAGVFDAEAYGVRSSAADMIRFVEVNMRPGTLEPAMRHAVEGTQAGWFRIGEMVQGLGWEQYPWPVAPERLLAGNSRAMILEANEAKALEPPRIPSGPALFNKTGSTNGFAAYVAFVPEKRIGIVMLANRNFPIPERIRAAHVVLDQLAGERS